MNYMLTVHLSVPGVLDMQQANTLDVAIRSVIEDNLGECEVSAIRFGMLSQSATTNGNKTVHTPA